MFFPKQDNYSDSTDGSDKLLLLDPDSIERHEPQG